jgi:hypothetical protein
VGEDANAYLPVELDATPLYLDLDNGELRHAVAREEKTTEEEDDCRMDIPGPTILMGTRTDYSVGPWDYWTCVARYLLA